MMDSSGRDQARPQPLPEIVEPVDMCLADGRINPAAVGFSRHPVHVSNLRGWGRNKRWEYWGLVTPRHILGLTLSSLDYLKAHQLYLYDRMTGSEIVCDAISPPWAPALLPNTPGPLSARASTPKLTMTFSDVPGGTRLSVQSARVTAELVAADGGDSLGVVVPWGGRRLQYTVKDVARPLTGRIVVDGQAFEVPGGESFAVLDRGRGRWPYAMTWNWGAGSGMVDGRRIGLQVGGKWTDGTGSTENGLLVDGRLSYWPDELTWSYDRKDFSQPWRVTGESVAATLTPFHVRSANTNLAVAAFRVQQAFGVWSGTALDEAGREIALDGLVGWAEEARNRW